MCTRKGIMLLITLRCAVLCCAVLCCTKHAGPMAVGDVSWHHGWCLHAAAPQPPNTPPRLALAVSYFADGSRLLARKSDPSVYKHMLHDEDAESYSSWLSQCKDGGVARHPQLPLVLG